MARKAAGGQEEQQDYQQRQHQHHYYEQQQTSLEHETHASSVAAAANNSINSNTNWPLYLSRVDPSFNELKASRQTVEAAKIDRHVYYDPYPVMPHKGEHYADAFGEHSTHHSLSGK